MSVVQRAVFRTLTKDHTHVTGDMTSPLWWRGALDGEKLGGDFGPLEHRALAARAIEWLEARNPVGKPTTAKPADDAGDLDDDDDEPIVKVVPLDDPGPAPSPRAPRRPRQASPRSTPTVHGTGAMAMTMMAPDFSEYSLPAERVLGGSRTP